MSANRSPGQLARFSRYLVEGARLPVDAIGVMLTAFARGESFALPPVSFAHDGEVGLEWLTERALIIAEYALFASSEERLSVESLANAKIIAERRAAFGIAAWGAEAKADELAADLSIPIPAAIAKLKEVRAQARRQSSIPSVEERARSQVELGPSDDPFNRKSKSNTSSLSEAVSRALGSNQ